MTNILLPPVLTDEQKARVRGVLSVGCDRETAANYIGCTTADLKRAMEQDAEFSAEVHRTEAGSELAHMKTVKKAVEDVKNWRASVWWLGMHAPDRFMPRSIGEVTVRQLEEFVTVLSSIIYDEVQSGEDRKRVIARMTEAVCELDELVRANQSAFAAASRLEGTRFLSVFDDEPDELDSPEGES